MNRNEIDKTKNQNALIAAIVAVIEENPTHPEIAESIVTGTLETLLEPYRERADASR